MDAHQLRIPGNKVVDLPGAEGADVAPAFAGPVGELTEGPVLQESHLQEIVGMRCNEESAIGGKREHPDVHGVGAAQTEDAENNPEREREKAKKVEEPAQCFHWTPAVVSQFYTRAK